MDSVLEGRPDIIGPRDRHRRSNYPNAMTHSQRGKQRVQASIIKSRRVKKLVRGRIPCSGVRTLFFEKNSLLGLQKFPVALRREAWCWSDHRALLQEVSL
jgi:hypothetical protein